MSNTKELINKLNAMLKQEHACAIRYATHAAVISGPASDSIKARFKEISSDEVMHAEKLRDRIIALGGEPTMDISIEDLKSAKTLDQMLNINTAEEKHAIAEYSELLSLIPQSNVILYQTILEIIRDEQEHLEELDNLR